MPWCAFLDPSGTLYAPGVAAAGVELERLLVVRPSVEALSRVALRIVESGACAVTIVDLLGVSLGQSLSVNLTASGCAVVRRLAMGVDGTPNSVILLTDAAEQRPLRCPWRSASSSSGPVKASSAYAW